MAVSQLKSVIARFDCTLNSSAANLRTAVKGAASGTVKTLKGNFGSEVRVTLKVTFDISRSVSSDLIQDSGNYLQIYSEREKEMRIETLESEGQMVNYSTDREKIVFFAKQQDGLPHSFTQVWETSVQFNTGKESRGDDEYSDTTQK